MYSFIILPRAQHQTKWRHLCFNLRVFQFHEQTRQCYNNHLGNSVFYFSGIIGWDTPKNIYFQYQTEFWIKVSKKHDTGVSG